MRAALLLLLFLGACTTAPKGPPPLGPGEVRDVRAVDFPKGSSKQSVRAALGPATEVAFDSGWAVWVYRQQLKEKEAPPRAELVLLFDPAGRLAKTRVAPVH